MDRGQSVVHTVCCTDVLFGTFTKTLRVFKVGAKSVGCRFPVHSSSLYLLKLGCIDVKNEAVKPLWN